MLYKIIERIVPGGARRGERKRLFSFLHRKRISFDGLLDRMTRRGGVNRGDIIRIVYRLGDAVQEELQNGNTVEVKGLGCFSLSVKYNYTEGEEWPRFSRHQVEDVKVVFRPAKELKMDVGKLCFQQQRSPPGI